jgi:two-component system NtrC family sensor kinase
MTSSTNMTEHSNPGGLLLNSMMFDANEFPLEKILIVDDEESVRNLFSFFLESRYNCIEAASVPEALERIAENEFELIVTDFMMPELTGVDLLERVADIAPDTVVVMVSGAGDPQSGLEAVRRGAFDYLTKPCDLNDLELTVERALAHRRLTLEARQYKLDLENRNRQLAHGKAELERMQAQIIHHEKMASLGQLAAGVAHEINNPVGFIYGNLSVLKKYLEELRELLDFYERTELNSEAAAGAEAIKRKLNYRQMLKNLTLLIEDCHDGAQRISGIVRNLRTFSRLDEAEFSKTNIHEGINSTVRLLSRYYSAGNITLKREYADVPLIDGFAGQLNQVWLNLLVNAAQAVGNETGEVVIETSVEKDHVTVKISDTGGGIAPEHLNRIFEPFYTTKPVGEGSGLGLSISFGIIAQHGGTFDVRSELNQGTSFTVRLPIENSNLPEETQKIYQKTVS